RRHAGEMRDRPPHDEDRDDDEGRRLSQRRQMLGLPVTVCVAGIRRASGDTNREERQQRRDQVDSGVRRLREQPETVRGDPCGDLERDQRAGREHGDESGAALWGHALSIPKKKSPPWWALLAGGCAAIYASAMSPLNFSLWNVPAPWPCPASGGRACSGLSSRGSRT